MQDLLIKKDKLILELKAMNTSSNLILSIELIVLFLVIKTTQKMIEHVLFCLAKIFPTSELWLIKIEIFKFSVKHNF